MLRYLLLGLAILCAVALIIELDTGSLETFQVAGIGLLLVILAAVVPPAWPPQ